MKNLQEKTEKVRTEINGLRATLRLLESEKFQIAYMKADKEQKEALLKLLDSKDLLALQKLIFKLTHGHLWEKNIRDLRELGRRNRVLNYGRLSRDELLNELEAIYEREESAHPGTGEGGQDQ